MSNSQHVTQGERLTISGSFSERGMYISSWDVALSSAGLPPERSELLEPNIPPSCPGIHVFRAAK
jgi:hypothetical protein